MLCDHLNIGKSLMTHFSHFCTFSGLCHPSKSCRAKTHPEGGILWDFSLRFGKSDQLLYIKILFPPTIEFIYLNIFVISALMLHRHVSIILRQWLFWIVKHMKKKSYWMYIWHVSDYLIALSVTFCMCICCGTFAEGEGGSTTYILIIGYTFSYLSLYD